MKTAWEIIRQAIRQWRQDGAFVLAAALAFYAAVSLAPLVTISLLFASLFYGEEALRGELVVQAEQYIGSAGAEVIQSILVNARTHGSGMSAVLSIAMLLAGASAVFVHLQRAMNAVFNVAPAPDRPWRHTLKVRLVSVALVLGMGFLLLVFTLAGAALSFATSLLAGRPGLGGELAWQAATFLLGVVAFTVIFAALFKLLPDAIIRWRDVWLGALITSALFNAGRFAIGLYLGKSVPGSVYGTAGALIALLLWLYYSALILFLGAELTQVLARRFGHRIRPAAYAFRTSALTLRVDDDDRPVLEAENIAEVKDRVEPAPPAHPG